LVENFDVNKVREALAHPLVVNPQETIEAYYPVEFKGAQVVVVVGCNWFTWSRISTNIPPELKPFEELKDAQGETRFPGETEGNLFLFVKSTRSDVAYEAAQAFLKRKQLTMQINKKI
jgi:deferrochelatase/peroxidase EfeB